VAFARYRHDLRRDYKRLEAFDTSMLKTPFGRVEYAQSGEGPPVLVLISPNSAQPLQCLT